MAAAPKRIILVASGYTDMPAKPEEKEANKAPAKTGWYLPEMAHPWCAFTDKGYEMVFVSPKGGLVDCDEGSVAAFAKDPQCQRFAKEKLNDKYQLETVKITDVKDAVKYDVLFYAGGHGTMFDFPDDKELNKFGAQIYEAGAIVAAVCHGPAGILNIELSNGKKLVDGKTVTGFTNEEEEAVGLTGVVPFALESELKKRGAKFTCVKNWGSNVEVSERLVTGQNPASSEALGKAIVGLLEKK